MLQWQNAYPQDFHSSLNIDSFTACLPPAKLKAALPITGPTASVILEGRRAIAAIIERRDPRLFVAVIPTACIGLGQIMAFALRLKKLADAVRETLVLVLYLPLGGHSCLMGRKGMINRSETNGTWFGLALYQARYLLLTLAHLGLPAAAEASNQLIPHYLADLLSWMAIGADASESQTHREMASGLSVPVGFNNVMSGNIEIALNGIKSAAMQHHFLGINQLGQCVVIHTRGNGLGHIILNGGTKPDYDAASIARCEQALRAHGLHPTIMVNCCDGNAGGELARQPGVLNDCIEQVCNGNQSLIGLMIAASLDDGSIEAPGEKSRRNQSLAVGEQGLGSEMTETCIFSAHARLMQVIANRRKKAPTWTSRPSLATP